MRAEWVTAVHVWALMSVIGVTVNNVGFKVTFTQRSQGLQRTQRLLRLNNRFKYKLAESSVDCWQGQRRAVQFCKTVLTNHCWIHAQKLICQPSRLTPAVCPLPNFSVGEKKKSGSRWNVRKREEPSPGREETQTDKTKCGPAVCWKQIAKCWTWKVNAKNNVWSWGEVGWWEQKPSHLGGGSLQCVSAQRCVALAPGVVIGENSRDCMSARFTVLGFSLEGIKDT